MGPWGPPTGLGARSPTGLPTIKGIITMTVQQNNMMLLDASGLPRTIDTANDSIQLDVPVSIQAALEVGADLSVAGDLTVQGDIVSRSQTDVIIQDSFLDLNFGDDSATVSGGGFTVSMAKASGFTTETVTDFSAGAGGNAPTFTVSGGSSNLSAGDVVAIAAAGDSENDGLFIVDSVAAGVVTIKGAEGTAPSGKLPFVQTQFKAATSQTAKAYKVDLAAVAVADGSNMVDSGASAWPVGTLVSGYMASATESGWSWDAPTSVSLDEAYEVGNQINTDSGTNVIIAGDAALQVTASGGLLVSNNATISGNTSMGGTLSVTGESTLASATVSDLTSGRVVLAGTAGSLEDNGNLTFSGSTLAVTGSITASVDATLASAKVSDLTAGRVVLAGTAGEIEDSGNLTFDGSTLDLTGALTASGNASVGGNLSVTGTSAMTGNVTMAGTLAVTGAATLSNGGTVSGAALDVQNGLIANSAQISDLTDNRIVIAGASGELEDDANFTFDGTDFKVGASGGSHFSVAAADGDTSIGGTLAVTGQSTLASAAISDLTSGRVVLAGTAGEIEDSGNLTFDGSTLAVTGAATISSTLGVTGASTLGSTLAVAGDVSVNTDKFTVDAASGDTAIAGTLAVTGESTLASATVSDLTDNRIIIAGASGALEDDANFRFDGTNFQIGAAGSEKFEVTVSNGNTKVSGTLTVDGQSTLDGLLDANAGAEISSLKVEDLTSGRVVLAGAGGEIEDSGNLTFNGSLLDVTGAVQTSGNATIGGEMSVSGDALFSATGGSHSDPDFKVDGYADFLGTVHMNSASSLDFDGSAFDVQASGKIKMNTASAGADAIVIDASDAAGSVDIDAGDDIMVDAGGDLAMAGANAVSLKLLANDAADKMLVIDAQNAGAGMGTLHIDADNLIQIGDSNTSGLSIDLQNFVEFKKSGGHMVTAGEALADGDALYVKYDVDGPRYFKADANAASDDERIVVGIAGSAASAGDKVALKCVVGIKVKTALNPANPDIGKPVYLDTTAGALTLTAPTASGSTVFRIGYVAGTSNGVIHFMPQFIAKRP